MLGILVTFHQVIHTLNTVSVTLTAFPRLFLTPYTSATKVVRRRKRLLEERLVHLAAAQSYPEASGCALHSGFLPNRLVMAL